MSTWKKAALGVSVIMLVCALIGTATSAGGPPLKDNVCGACHQDYGKIMPEKHPDVGKGIACMACHTPDPAKKEATRFSTDIHTIHQGGKTKLECSSCHAL